MPFHENWYSDAQARDLARLCRFVKPLQGAVLEIGCWEGKSTCAIANAVAPESVIAVDTWEGSSDEDPAHESVVAARSRDVFSVFMLNVQECTAGNVTPVRLDCHDFLASFKDSLKLCHIDASHDYSSVQRAISSAKPLIVPGGVLCGDDYLSAHMNRADLNGGVQRAVSELLPGHEHRGNLWFWVRPSGLL